MAVARSSRPPGAPPRPSAVVLRWPEDAGARDEARRAGRPRLLLLEPGTPPPPPEDGEDWAWCPVDERDLASRLRRLGAIDRPPAPTVEVDADDVLRAGGRLVALPPVEAALLRCLAAEPRRLRTREELARAAWGDGARTRRSLDSRVLSLRRRIAATGLAVRAERGRGFVLEVGPEAAP